MATLTEEFDVKFSSSTFPGYVLAGCKGALSMTDGLGEVGDSLPKAMEKVAIVASLSDLVTS